MGGAVSLGFWGLREFCATATGQQGDKPVGFGPLRTDPERALDLPQGFSYHVISKVGQRMDDGFHVPAMHDGMAAFAGPEGTTVLIRNHEIGSKDATRGPFGERNEQVNRVDLSRLYDPGFGAPAMGGTTTIVYDTKRHRLRKHFLSLAGTLRNCAGGPTPWNTWISCEETTQTRDDKFEVDHGYNFEVPATTRTGLAYPRPLKAMGRFVHEAVAVDAGTGIVYQSEDLDDGLLYRFVPDHRGDLGAGGRLQALAIRDHASLDTRNWPDERGEPADPTIHAGETMDVRWIDLDDVESPADDLRLNGWDKGAARFARGEGIWSDRHGVYFACTTGGAGKLGQIWRYQPSPQEARDGEQQQPGRLELFIQSDDGKLLKNADNLTVAPWGDVIVCEDSEGPDRIIAVTPNGRLYVLAQNAASNSELAGVTFSPDGSTLFVNIQEQGVTLAITGPWHRGYT